MASKPKSDSSLQDGWQCGRQANTADLLKDAKQMGRNFRSLHRKEELCSDPFGPLIWLLLVKMVDSIKTKMGCLRNPEISLRRFGSCCLNTVPSLDIV